MNVTTKRLDALKHPKKNVRIHSEQQIRELKRSLEKFGQTRAIVVDEDDTILIGNGLYEASEMIEPVSHSRSMKWCRSTRSTMAKILSGQLEPSANFTTS